MADVQAQAKISVYADTAPAVREINKLTESQDKTLKKTEEAQKSFAGFVSGVADGFAKFNLALGGVQKAFGLLRGVMDWTREIDQLHKLEKAVPVSTFQKLDEATKGLFTRTQLLTFASRALVGDLKLTENQMADVLNAARVLADRGFGELEQNEEKLLKAVQKGGEGLDDYGLAIQKTNDKAKDAAQVLEKLHGIAASDAMTNEAKSIAEVNRAFDDLSLTFKETLVPAVSTLIELLSDAVQFWGDLLGGKDVRIAQFQLNEQRKKTEQYLIGREFGDDLQAANEDYTARLDLMVRGGRMTESDYANAITGFLGTPVDKWVGIKTPGRGESPYSLGGRAGYTNVGEREVNPFSAVGEGDFGAAAFDDRNLDLIGNRSSRFEDAGTGPIEYGYDKLSTFKTQLEDANSVVGATYATLSTGITAAVEAAISGSDSIGRAAAKASAAVLKSLAIESTGRAAYEGALAIGSLAIGDAKGASLHGLAAAKYALAASITGSLSAGLGALASSGGGSTAASPGAAGGGFGSPTGGRSESGPVNVTVNVGFGFDGDAKKIEEAVRRGVRQAQLKGGRSNYATEVSG